MRHVRVRPKSTVFALGAVAVLVVALLVGRAVVANDSHTLNTLDWMRFGTVPLMARQPNGSLTPDGTIHFRGDLEAIQWFRKHVQGTPVIAEASIGAYRCNGSRISINTGLPSIIGWAYPHESQQRYPEGIAERVNDVRQLYISPDPAVKRQILTRYDVEYVIVGDLERDYPYAINNDCIANGSAAGIAAFDQMVGSSLEIVFQQDGTTIYQVIATKTKVQQRT